MSQIDDAALVLSARPAYDADNNPDPWQIDEDLWAACRNVAGGFQVVVKLLEEAVVKVPGWAGVNDDAHGWYVRAKQVLQSANNGGEKWRG